MRIHALIGLSGVAALVGGALTEMTPTLAAENGAYLVYVGTYTGAKSKGIYAYRLQESTGELSSVGLVAETVNPTFLALHPSGDFLYAANEVGQFSGKRSGAVSAFAINKQTGALRLLNQASSGGPGPCHLVVDKNGKFVLLANYGGGSVAVLPIGGDGRVSEPVSFIQHQGSSVNPARQEAPHAHSINLDEANRFAFAADLGLDQVRIYRFDSSTGSLLANDPPGVAVKAGSGPRHFAFHPKGQFAYVINELFSTVTALAYDARRGALKEIQTVSTLPEGFTGKNTTAEVQVHPSGKFLYGSNRGHNSIAVFAINQVDGTLTLTEHGSTRGKTPRNFAVAPTGRHLLAANQDSDNIVVFGVDPKDGRLTYRSEITGLGAPVCLKFLRTK